MNKKFFIILVTLFLLICANLFAQEIEVGQIAPDFSVTLQDRTQFVLSKQKTPVLINFWATWCPPCVAELPYMQKLSEDIKNTNSKLQFIAICVSDSQKNMNKFLSKNKYTFNCALDENGTYAANKYRVSAIPLTVLVSKEGKVLKTHVGSMSQSQLNEFVKDVK